MEKFKIKSYGKSELALLYFPNACTAGGALCNLRYWINGNKRLLQEIRDCGSPVCAKSFTPREVALIVMYLGEP